MENVKRTRGNWSGPTNYSCLCSCHFTEDFFQHKLGLAAAFGVPKKNKLKADAVPTIFKRPLQDQESKAIQKKKQSKSERDARYNRRQQRKVCESLLLLSFLNYNIQIANMLVNVSQHCQDVIENEESCSTTTVPEDNFDSQDACQSSASQSLLVDVDSEDDNLSQQGWHAYI